MERMENWEGMVLKRTDLQDSKVSDARCCGNLQMKELKKLYLDLECRGLLVASLRAISME